MSSLSPERLRPLVVVCGVRPHYIKAAALSRVLDTAGVLIVDARQQYDSELTDLVIEDVGLKPDLVFKHSSLKPGTRAGSIYAKLTALLGRYNRCPAVLSFGDTTTTLMAASAAVATGCTFVHMEAGVRSAPGVGGSSIENQIRRMIGQVSAVNFCVLPEHVTNLATEQAPGQSVWIGDIMRDLVLSMAGTMTREECLCLIHKTENTTGEGISEILAALAMASRPVSFVVHPSVRRLLATERDLEIPANVTLVPPMPYSALARRLSEARVVLTDSGGVQREAFYLKVRCVVRRDTAGWGSLFGEGGHLRVGRQAAAIAAGVVRLWESPDWTLPGSPGFVNPRGASLARRILDEVRHAG